MENLKRSRGEKEGDPLGEHFGGGNGQKVQRGGYSHGGGKKGGI